MKKVFLIAAFSLISLSTYAKRWYYNCPGGGRVYFTTSDDTTSAQAAAMGQAWCDNREILVFSLRFETSSYFFN